MREKEYDIIRTARDLRDHGRIYDIAFSVLKLTFQSNIDRLREMQQNQRFRPSHRYRRGPR